MITSKYITVESPGSIPELGGISGPIKTPFMLDINTIITLMNRGKTICEVNPAKPKEKVVLTRSNVMHQNFTTETKIENKRDTVKNTNVVSTSKVQPIGVDVFISNKNA